MRKSLCILLCILLIGAGAVYGFAEDGAPPDDAPEAASAFTLDFTEEEIQMSLDDARHRMLTDSTAIEAADQRQMANRAKTRSYYENERDLNAIARMSGEERREAGVMGGASRTRREMATYQSNFAIAQTQRNYDAEVNKIVYDTVKEYYTLAQAKEALRISQENAAIQETLYQNTQSKYNVGTVAKQDVLRAELGLSEAVVSARKSENDYALVRMSFNMLIGLDLMQSVALTDSLEESPISDISLDQAVSEALANRNEIAGADYWAQVAEYNLREVGNNASRSTARYRQAQAELTETRNASKNAPNGIEMDVKSKYMNMTQKQSEVELGKLRVETAKEAYRLANLQYDAGMATLADAQQAQYGAYQAELAYYMTLLDYNLSIIEYEQSMTVGTMSVVF